MSASIRPACRDDAQAIAALHWRMWRETYRGLAPERAYEILTEPARLSRWRDILAQDRHGRSLLVAGLDGQLAGFGVAGPSSHEVFGTRAEVKHLYVDSAFKRMGIGRMLLCSLARDMMRCGHRGMALGVVVGNHPAIAFYEALGGRRAGRYTDPGPVWRSENFLFAWDDLRRLAAKAPDRPE